MHPFLCTISYRYHKAIGNWKGANISLQKTQRIRDPPCEAVEVIITLPKFTPDVGEMLVKAHKTEKENARGMFAVILSSVHFLARRGLALRGNNDADSNLTQLLQLRVCDNLQVTEWLKEMLISLHLTRSKMKIVGTNGTSCSQTMSNINIQQSYYYHGG